MSSDKTTPAATEPATTVATIMSPPNDAIMQWFQYDHLPASSQSISKPFCDLAQWVHDTLPRSAERTVALRKLLESKDAAVRANIAVIP